MEQSKIELILQILEEICDDSIVREDFDIELFDNGLLDSVDFMDLLVSIESELGIYISPSSIEREEVNTPGKIIQYIEARQKK